MDQKTKDIFISGVAAGRKAFKVLIEETGGDVVAMIFALSSILSSIETQHPGTIADVEEGASLLFDRHVFEMTMN